MNLKDYIASIENYPQEGITFRDISPLMADGNAYSYAIREIVQYATDKKIDMIVGPEARGFIVGCPVALSWELGLRLFVSLVNCHVKSSLLTTKKNTVWIP